MANATTVERPAPGRIRALPGVRSRFRRGREGYAAYWFVVPIIIVFVVLYLIPMAQSLYYSFTDYNGYVSSPTFIGIKNYISIWRDPSMLSALGFTLGYAVLTTLIVTVLAIPLALVLNRRFFGRGFVRSVFFFPAVPSVAILGLVWTFILSPLGSGVINSVIGHLGIAPVPWLSDETLAQVSVIMVAVWAQTGWHAMLYLAYLQSLPADVFEAAKIDGANRWQEFRMLTLPLLMPAVSVSTLLLLTNGLKVYDLPFTLTKGGPGFATRTLTQSIIENGIAQSDIGKASALSVLFLIAVGLIIVVQLAVSRRLQERYS
ncbi:raffinose/stachyose/melibiose transport system permease protein [Arthrobacter pascens]|uniref:carbohydrate ABC transporter permease n=1 Tax=Arthrobacter pascens TaxID=1677 RepID=UPI002784DFA5|nr:sugar ABC transporter permease [Arthrobacter pascens]MDQ0634280.1 raffinose/stachyose/melibiose transport system permease protein [Arthrobacter pascens]